MRFVTCVLRAVLGGLAFFQRVRNCAITTAGSTEPSGPIKSDTASQWPVAGLAGLSGVSGSKASPRGGDLLQAVEPAASASHDVEISRLMMAATDDVMDDLYEYIVKIMLNAEVKRVSTVKDHKRFTRRDAAATIRASVAVRRQGRLDGRMMGSRPAAGLVTPDSQPGARRRSVQAYNILLHPANGDFRRDSGDLTKSARIDGFLSDSVLPGRACRAVFDDIVDAA